MHFCFTVVCYSVTHVVYTSAIIAAWTIVFYLCADTKPSIAQLMRLKTKERKVEVIKSLTPHWRELGLLMDFDGEGRTVDLIEAEYQMKGQTACCQEMFKLWLKGPHATWGNLIELLVDCEQKALAEQVKDTLGLQINLG